VAFFGDFVGDFLDAEVFACEEPLVDLSGFAFFVFGTRPG
jgi:hypothetical protein